MSNYNEEAIERYASSGVNLKKSDRFIKLIKHMSENNIHSFNHRNENIGDFAGLFELKKLNYSQPVLAACSDGVGTKIEIAISANNHNNIGVDLVAMCVNDLVTKGAKPLFFLDYIAVKTFIEKRDMAIMDGITKACNAIGCELLGGETAQMNNLKENTSYELSGFAVGIVEKNKILPFNNLMPGDVIIGLSSNGVHANGFSLIRNIIKTNKIDLKQTILPNCTESLADILLSPTRIYVPTILNSLEKFNEIKAIAHITGGGVLANLPRVLPNNLNAVLHLKKFNFQPIFSWVAQELSFNSLEMLSIFNCGVGMMIVTQKEVAKQLCAYLEELGETASIIGYLCEGEKKIELESEFKLV